jgi:hypothetical protein
VIAPLRGMRLAQLHNHDWLTWNTWPAGGATLQGLRANAGAHYPAATCMNLDDTSLVERAAVEKAAMEWAHRKFLNAMASSSEPREKESRHITCRWLRFAGRLQEPARPSTPHQAELDAYCR